MNKCTLLVKENNYPIGKIHLENPSGRVEWSYTPFLGGGSRYSGVVKPMGKDSHLLWGSEEFGYLINFSLYHYNPRIRYIFKHTLKSAKEKRGIGHYKIETYMCDVDEELENFDDAMNRL